MRAILIAALLLTSCAQWGEEPRPAPIVKKSSQPQATFAMRFGNWQPHSVSLPASKPK